MPIQRFKLGLEVKAIVLGAYQDFTKSGVRSIRPQSKIVLGDFWQLTTL
jgi:hypothetical protein